MKVGFFSMSNILSLPPPINNIENQNNFPRKHKYINKWNLNEINEKNLDIKEFIFLHPALESSPKKIKWDSSFKKKKLHRSISSISLPINKKSIISENNKKFFSENKNNINQLNLRQTASIPNMNITQGNPLSSFSNKETYNKEKSSKFLPVKYCDTQNEKSNSKESNYNSYLPLQEALSEMMKSKDKLNILNLPHIQKHSDMKPKTFNLNFDVKE